MDNVLMNEKYEKREIYTYTIDQETLQISNFDSNKDQIYKISIIFINGIFHNVTYNMVKMNRNTWKLYSCINRKITEIEELYKNKS